MVTFIARALCDRTAEVLREDFEGGDWIALGFVAKLPHRPGLRTNVLARPCPAVFRWEATRVHWRQGGTMANYYPLLLRMIASLGNNSPEARRRLYECARAALLGLFRSELELARERGALEMAILRIEEEARQSVHACQHATAA
jgi:hypothetical protein